MPRRARFDEIDAPAVGLASAVVLMALAMIVPPAIGWDVHALTVPPLAAHWQPRVGWGTVPALLLAVAGVRCGPVLAQTLSLGRLLVTAYAAGVAWLVSLATVDGWSGLSQVFDRPGEYLATAHQIHDISGMLHHFIAHIPLRSPDNWPVHVAGHPPGALLFFVLLVHLGLGGPLATGWTIVLISATTPLAVLLTLHRMGASVAARRVAPFLVLGPAAVWSAVSADAMFAAVAAWGLCCLACGATARRVSRRVLLSLGAGLLLGYCAFLSYGLPLLAVLAIGVLILSRTVWPALGLAAGAAAVVAAFAAAGFEWWRALPVVHKRYYAGIAHLRPAGYWVWGDLAALCFSAGPLLGAGVAAVAARLRSRLFTDADARAAVILCSSAVVAVLAADLSFMSKAEVERIWLPFVPWLLLGVALLPSRWRRWGLAGQVTFALGMQMLLFTLW